MQLPFVKPVLKDRQDEVIMEKCHFGFENKLILSLLLVPKSIVCVVMDTIFSSSQKKLQLKLSVRTSNRDTCSKPACFLNSFSWFGSQNSKFWLNLS